MLYACQNSHYEANIKVLECLGDSPMSFDLPEVRLSPVESLAASEDGHYIVAKTK